MYDEVRHKYVRIQLLVVSNISTTDNNANAQITQVRGQEEFMFNKPLNRWCTVVAGALGNAVGAGVVSTFVFGVFIKDISNEFGWDRSYTTAGISCFFILAGVGALVLGSFMARWSMRSVTTVFVSLFSLSIMLIAILPKSLILFCLIFSLMGFFASAASPMPYALAISRQFDRNRGIALALMISGTAVGAVLLPSYANLLMESYSWRVGYLGLGLIVGTVSLAGLVFFFRTPPLAPEHLAVQGLSFKDIYRSGKTFWLIAISIFCISIALIGVITNLVPILTDRGATSAKAASIVGILGGASMVSRVGVGALVDRMHARYVAAGIFLISALGISFLAFGMGGTAIYIAAVCIGLGIGAEADLLTFLMSRYFPAESLSRALGAVWIFWAWGNALGVFAGSLSYDLTGDYSLALFLFIGLALLCWGLILQLGPYRFPVHTTAP